MNCAVPRVGVKVGTPVVCFLTHSFAWKHSLKVPVISIQILFLCFNFLLIELCKMLSAVWFSLVLGVTDAFSELCRENWRVLQSLEGSKGYSAANAALCTATVSA